MESNESGVMLKEESWFSQFRTGYNPLMARYVYGFMFLGSNLLAWAVRDYGNSALIEMKRLKGCHGVRDCLGAEGVLRISLGCFTFYFIMFLTTVGTSKLNGRRDSWQSRWWSVKIVLWIALTVIPFLLPSTIIHLYGIIAHFGAGVFLLIQLISIISFITLLNEWFQSKKYAEKCHIHVMLLATAAYVVCLVGIIMMYIWYAPDSSCLLNIFFISWTLVLLQLMTSVSLHPKVNAGILTPGLMGLYVVFICWCAIRSEPPGENCNRKAEASTKTDWLTIISFVVAVSAMVIATFSTGIDSKCFQKLLGMSSLEPVMHCDLPAHRVNSLSSSGGHRGTTHSGYDQCRKDEARSEDDVSYGYGFFHFVFATGAMYFGMLLISWSTNHSMRKWTIDVGWTSTWVRVVNEWLAVSVYLWLIVAPIIWKHRQTGESV